MARRPTKDVWFVTGNANKVAETNAILDVVDLNLLYQQICLSPGIQSLPVDGLVLSGLLQ